MDTPQIDCKKMMVLLNIPKTYVYSTKTYRCINLFAKIFYTHWGNHRLGAAGKHFQSLFN